jgi:Carbohydrate binding domain/Hypothetical glycosyl hydrolase family 15
MTSRRLHRGEAGAPFKARPIPADNSRAVFRLEDRLVTHHSRFAPVAFVFALAVFCVCAAAPARAQNYPRLALYGEMTGNGYPLWDSTGTLQTMALDAISRYDEVVIEASPITPYRPDAIAAIRARNPQISMLAYVAPCIFYPGLSPDSLVDVPSRLIRTVRNNNGYLYNKKGAQFGGININLAKRDAFGRYTIAESLAVLWNDAIVKSALWDGIFIDVYCDGIGWMETASDSIDFVRAGYASAAAFETGWKAGTDTLADRLRQLAGSTQVLVGNCASGTKYVPFNGWMRENFPFQQGGTWYSNMFNDPGGYFGDEQHFRTPRHNYIFSAVAGVNTPYDPTNTRKVRFGLASAAMGSGYHAFGPSNRITLPSNYHLWWYDEYAVDLSTGMAATDRAHTGWLGQALAPYYQMIWAGSGPDAVTNAGFETDVTTGWTMFTAIGSTVSADATSPAVGAESAHITVPAAGSVPWATAFATVGTITVQPLQVFSATFWARASRPRNIVIAAAKTTSGEFTSVTQAITTDWKQYQVAMNTNQTGPSRLAFYLAGEDGDVWLDDCHFHNGATTIYRRDFQNGIVLLNPSGSALTLPLERSFRRISGIADPVVNNGSTVSQVTIQPSDALFLIGSDQIPPSTISDLHRVP